MNSLQQHIRWGTCSWNYPSWVGVVYTSLQPRAAGYLREYAQHFDTAEIDSWFYRIPERDEVAEYLAQVPEGFRFTCKAPRELTVPTLRARGASGSEAPNPSFLSDERFARFLEVIEPMLPRLDAIMFEFEYLNRQRMPSLTAFLDALDRFTTSLRARFGQLPFAIETRNRNFLTESFFRFLLEHKLLPVFSEKIYMPHAYEVYALYRELVQSDAVIRLLGGDRGAIEEKTGMQWNAIIDPKPAEEKRAILSMAMDLAARGHAVTINVNNHYEGSAPLTIEDLKARLSGMQYSGDSALPF